MDNVSSLQFNEKKEKKMKNYYTYSSSHSYCFQKEWFVLLEVFFKLTYQAAPHYGVSFWSKL